MNEFDTYASDTRFSLYLYIKNIYTHIIFIFTKNDNRNLSVKYVKDVDIKGFGV